MARVGAGDLRPMTPSDAAALSNIDEVETGAVFETRPVIHMHGATLASFKVMQNGLGFDVHFTVPLVEADTLPDLTTYLQRLCEVRVAPFSRKKGVMVQEDDEEWGDPWGGRDD